MKYICARLANATTSNCNTQGRINMKKWVCKANSTWTHETGLSHLPWLAHHQRRMACRPTCRTEPWGHSDQTLWFLLACAHPFLVPSLSWLPANVTHACQKLVLCSYYKNILNLIPGWWDWTFKFQHTLQVKCEYSRKKQNILWRKKWRLCSMSQEPE